MSGGITKRATQKKNGKYAKQFERTAANKARRKAKEDKR